MTTKLREQAITTSYRPRAWALEVHEAIARHRFNVLVCHRRAGKTVVCVNVLIAAAVATPNGRFAYFAPQLKTARAISWSLFREYTDGIPGVVFKEADLTVVFPNGATVQLFSGEQHDSARGQGFDGVVLDEVAQFPIEAWGSSIRPTLSDRGGWAIMIGTPRGADAFFDFFQRGQDPSQTEWWSASYPVTVTGVLSDAEISSAQRSATSPDQFRREYLCDFNASVDEALIPIPLVQQAMRRAISYAGGLAGSPKVLGVDVARFGSDRTVLMPRWGRQVLPATFIDRSDLMFVVGVVSQLIERWAPDAVFVDATGVGGGVVDRLQQLGHDVVGVDFGARASDSRFSNMRAQCWFRMKEWLEEGGVLPDDIPGLMADLTSAQYGFDTQNRLKLEGKADIKKRLGNSPDAGDALAITFAYPVTPALRPAGWIEAGAAGAPARDYNPFQNI